MQRACGYLAVLFVVFAFAHSGCNQANDPNKLTDPNKATDPNTVTIEHTDYKPPPPPADELTDDELREDQAPKFDPDLVHSKPIGEWQINLSAAVVKLDVEMSRPDSESNQLQLAPSYAEALKFRPDALPSVNLIDGKAKQFDDGLYAALDRAYYRGLTKTLRGHVDLVKGIAEKVGPKSSAAAYLAAGLELAGIETQAEDAAAKSRWRQQFDANAMASKPVGFYTWNDDLKQCFCFLRFLQQEVPLGRDPEQPHAEGVMLAIAEALDGDSALKADYEQMLAFYARLTNPPREGFFHPAMGAEAIRQAARSPRAPAAAFLPSSTSRENELFRRLFPMGLPPDANLMQELIRAIKSGEVDLAPSADSGWYEHQAFALETLVLPERGEEAFKLLRTARYKRRMLEAFAALITKRRETHLRQMDVAKSEAAPPPLETLSPRLRVEPHPTYYLRTARAYTFLQKFLHERVGQGELATLHGLTAEGERSLDLAAELEQMRTLFYGMYLISCEDLGMRPSTTADETGDPAAAMAAAEKWLGEIKTDPDLAADTRVIVPVYYDPMKGEMSVWATAGVRLVKLSAAYDPRFPPSLRPASGGDWKKVGPHQLETTYSVIAVDEFITCQIPTLKPLTREEFRKLCDEHKTKDKIIAALQSLRP